MPKLNEVYNRAIVVLRQEKLTGLIKKGIIKRISNNMNYLYYSNTYPQSVIFIAGFAKAGTTWFANMLSEIKGFDKFTPLKWPLKDDNKREMDLYTGVFKEFKNKLAVVKGHTWGTDGNVAILNNEYKGKYIILVRDPRDALISAYWYIKKHSSHWDYMNVSQMSLDEYIDYKLESTEFKTQFVDWLQSWIRWKEAENNIIIRYEDLLLNTFNELNNIVALLGFELNKENIENIITKYEFSKMTGRKRGTADNSSFNRKAVSGEYLSVFNEKQKALAASQAKNVLEELGYDI